LGNMDWEVMPKMKTRKERYSAGLELAHMSDIISRESMGAG
jgi:hypothetical protein